MSTTASITFKEKGPITIGEIQAVSLLDTVAWQYLVDEIRDRIIKTKRLHLLLDFHHVEHVSIEFFGEMKELADGVTVKGGTLRVCGLNQTTQDILNYIAPDRVGYMISPRKNAIPRYLRYLKHNGYLSNLDSLQMHP